MAWQRVNPFGFICSDDFTWSDHGAWPAFCKRHGVMSDSLGAMAFFRKPAGPPAVEFDKVMEAHYHAIELARIAVNGRSDLEIEGIAQDGIRSKY